MQEIWKDVEGYEGYYIVSNIGNVCSLERKYIDLNGITIIKKSRLLKPTINKYGYLQFGLCLNNKICSYTAHRLVAIAFIENFNNKSTVNHIDGNKLNNNVSNLEWATKSEQAIHSLNMGLRIMPNSWLGKFGSKHGASKKIIQLSLNDEYINEFTSVIDATNILNLPKGGISKVCKGKKKTCGGFKWVYKKDYV